jgi:hypothetical protein
MNIGMLSEIWIAFHYKMTKWNQQTTIKRWKKIEHEIKCLTSSQNVQALKIMICKARMYLKIQELEKQLAPNYSHYLHYLD